VIYELGDRRPNIHESCFIAPNATVLGTVELAQDVSVWFNATIRGDTDLIRIGEGTNIQDGSVLHTDEGIQLVIGRRVTVGHKAMLHGCNVGDGSLIGIGATVLNHAVIGKHCLIGAHALITEGKKIPDRSLVVGAPGRVIRTLSDEAVEQLEEAARHYVDNAKRFLVELQPAPTQRSTSM
jgi:carbonic anhydrase/acetyltransferase-like protein (isoleucine patch superfamily)